MKIKEKITFLENNHFPEWFEQRKKTEEELSSQQPLKCVCGRLATGLHERQCARFRKKVDSLTVEQLKHLLT